MAKGDDIEGRLVDFAVRVIDLGVNLPKSNAGKHISGQLLRSGTAPAAHYAEARSAESSRHFQHKLKICLKELNESRIWLQIIIKSKHFSPPTITPLYQECDELCRIINTSIKTSRKNSRK